MQSIRDLYKSTARDTRIASKEYWLNVGFLSGHQWIWWNPNNNHPEELPVDDRIRSTFNRMATNHRTLISNLMQRDMAYEVFPNGANDASAQAAYTATEILYALAVDHNWERLREKNYINMLKGGTGVIAVDWDEKAQDSVETGLSIVECVVEPGAYDPEKARWWMKAQVFHPEEVQAMFDLSDLPEADASNGINPLAERLLEGHLGVEKVNPLTTVLTYYERPNPLEEEGKIIVDVGGNRVQEMKWPFPFTDRLNMVVGVETLVEHQWYGETIYSQARSPQVSYNLSKSNLSEHLRDAAVSRLLVPHSAIRIMEAMNDVPGNMHPYPDGLTPPAWLEPPQLPHWLQQLPADYRLDIDDIMGVHDVSRGKAPVNLESGTALSILAELDGTPVGRLLKEGSGMFGRMASMVLEMQEKFAKTKRIAVIDTGESPLSIEWEGKDIAGQYSAKVPLDSVIPRSRAAIQQMGMKLLEMGRIESMEDFARFIEMPGRRHLVNAMNPHVAKARRENSAMARGEVVLPATFDDDAVHIIEHNAFRTTPVYEMLDSEQQHVVDKHVEGHESDAAEAMGKMVGRAEAHPALGAAPTADGDPPVDPELMAMAPDMGLEGADTGEPLDPASMVDTMMASL
ncbi:MAG: hypothetical protein GY926_01395 [bacterium]|nr:hypothetical protein [bacterium]